jgi:hypothetical protein
MEKVLKGLERTIATGRLKDRNKMERRLGKIQARHPQVNDLYDVELPQTAEGVSLSGKWRKIVKPGGNRAKEARGNWLNPSRGRGYRWPQIMM